MCLKINKNIADRKRLINKAKRNKKSYIYGYKVVRSRTNYSFPLYSLYINTYDWKPKNGLVHYSNRSNLSVSDGEIGIGQIDVGLHFFVKYTDALRDTYRRSNVKIIRLKVPLSAVVACGKNHDGTDGFVAVSCIFDKVY